MVNMDGQWRFHTGDDPRWSQPNWDDAQWPLISGLDGWSGQGYPDYAGVAWYRAQVRVPKGAKSLSVYLCCVYTNYQLFADGQLIGTSGEMPPHPVAHETQQQVYRLPAAATAEAHTVLIAIRVWQWPHWASTYSGGLNEGARIGSTGLIDQFSEFMTYRSAWRQVSTILLTMLELLAGLTALALFSMRRKEPEYLWFGVSSLVYAAFRCVITYQAMHTTPEQLFNLFWYLGDTFTSLANVAFFYYLLKGRKDWYLLIVLVAVIASFGVGIAENSGLISQTLFGEITTALRVPTTVWVLALVFRRALQGLADAWLLLIPLLISRVTLLIDVVLSTAYYAGWYRGEAAWYYRTANWPFPFNVGDAADGLFLVGMVAILTYRFTRTSKQGERLATELEAARSVQQVMIPEEIPEVPGFTITTMYQPAGQVGGDFFQVMPTAGGGVLLVVGDVSGKGLPAAMTVALIVGGLATLIEHTDSPAELLAGLNRRLLRRGSGFTTCLALRAERDGNVTLANAGHLAPYCSGEEVEVSSGLPLGLLADAEYSENRFVLRAGEQITLVTDGVVEARSNTGELFGFARTLSISRQSARSIVETAQAFGQEDDITALTLQLAGSAG